MNTSRLTARIVAMSLAIGSFACRQPARAVAAADSPELPPPAAQPAAEPAPQEDSTPKATVGKPAPPQSTLAPAKVKPGNDQNLKSVKVRTMPPSAFHVDPAQVAYAQGRFRSYQALSPADVPDLLTTEPIDAKVEEEWREDLAVMDRLVREAVSGRAGDGNPSNVPNEFRSALGIELKVIGWNRSADGMYVEGAGVIFATGVNWPLAASADAQPADPARPREPDSPWERTKRQLKGGGRSGSSFGGAGGSFGGAGGMSGDEFGAAGEAAPPRMPFEQKRLDDLIDDILYVLPQAANFRHLKESEHVFVTVGGTDDAGKPVRLTLKAKKSDVDDAAAKKIDAETFKQRVTRRIG